MAENIVDLRSSFRVDLLRLNNSNARETSPLTPDKFNQMIAAAKIGTYVPPAAAFLLAFEEGDDYDGSHFKWFQGRYDKFLYIDRVVVAERHRRLGFGRLLYEDLFRRARVIGHTRIACEVNKEPPNPVSDRFHESLGFAEVATAAIDGGAKIVRYLIRLLPD
jgi:predicted GNAT superfamily acetyltransferase